MDFLKTYLDSVKELECPESYHIYAALGMLSSLPGKKIWSKRGAITTYPNIYVCLIGDAGSGKTTAMSLARGVLRKVDGINFAKKCPSAQEVIECCAAAQEEFDIDGKKYFHAPMAIFLSELSNFIQLSPELMIPFLTDAYDDDIFDYGTRHKGKFVIKEPVLSAVTCCTHSWLTDQQKNIRFNDGIGRRFLWLMDSPKERNPRPKAVLPPEILEVCKKIRMLSGEFEWSKEASKWWGSWLLTKFLYLFRCSSQIMQHFLQLTFLARRTKDGVDGFFLITLRRVS